MNNIYDIYKTEKLKHNYNTININVNKKTIFTPIIAPYPSYIMDYVYVSPYCLGHKQEEYYYTNRKGEEKFNYDLYNKHKLILLVLIEITSRYVIIYKMNNRTKKELINVLTDFISEYKPLNISSDMERSFISKDIKLLFKKHNIKQYTYNASKGWHTPLSIIDRFARTLRQIIFNFININNQYINIDILKNLIEMYNNKPHGGLPTYYASKQENKNGTNRLYKEHYTPADLFKHETLRNKQNVNKKHLRDLNGLEMLKNIRINDKVRILEGKSDDGKGLPRWSDEIYRVINFNGVSYTLDKKPGTWGYNYLLKVDEDKIKEIEDKKDKHILKQWTLDY